MSVMKIVYYEGIPLRLQAKQDVSFPLTYHAIRDGSDTLTERFSYDKPNNWNCDIDVYDDSMVLKFRKTDENGQAYTEYMLYDIPEHASRFTGEVEPKFYYKMKKQV